MEKTTLNISGMTCSGCVRSVTGVLTALDGVAKADVSLENKRAVVDFDPAKMDVQRLKQSVEDAGYEVTT